MVTQKIILPLILALTPIWATGKSPPVEKLNLPDGFAIETYAEVSNPTQMTQGGNGIIYVGSRRLGKVHAVIDRDGDFKAEEVTVIASGLKMPSGVAYKDGDLFVGAVNRILRYPAIDNQLADPPRPDVITDSLPDKTHHGWKFINFGPDDLLYIPVGAPCNICLSENPQFASIMRLDVTNPTLEIIAHGIRNTVGFDWHPISKQLWFTDNGRDMLGDQVPPGELNSLKKIGDHFGYPFFHADGLPDPKFGGQAKPASAYREPELLLDPHVAALGMMFYTGKMFPERYKNQILIPEHGSWNRSPEAGHTGYRITVGRKVGQQMRYEIFIDGWLESNNKSWGRPVHLLQMDDGSVLVSDDKADAIYRITYKLVSPF